MDNYKVVKYAPDFYNEWNDFIKNSKNGTFLFHRDFMEYHADRFEDFSLKVYKKEELIALFPANVLGKTIYSHQGLSYGGLILKKETKFNSVLSVFSVILEYLYRKNYEKLEIKFLPSIYNSLPNNEIDYIVFLLDGVLIKRESLSVINQKEVLKISKNRIEGCKRGIKNNLEILEENNFNAFWNTILIPNLKRKYNTSPVHSQQEITFLKFLICMIKEII